LQIPTDIHVIPGITAKASEKAHRMDLLIEEEFNRKCTVSTVDEENNGTFCLKVAPDETVCSVNNICEFMNPSKSSFNWFTQDLTAKFPKLATETCRQYITQ